MDDQLDPAAYERLAGASKQEYEDRLLLAAQSSMMDEWTVEPDDGPALASACSTTDRSCRSSRTATVAHRVGRGVPFRRTARVRRARRARVDLDRLV